MSSIWVNLRPTRSLGCHGLPCSDRAFAALGTGVSCRGAITFSVGAGRGEDPALSPASADARRTRPAAQVVAKPVRRSAAGENAVLLARHLDGSQRVAPANAGTHSHSNVIARAEDFRPYCSIDRSRGMGPRVRRGRQLCYAAAFFSNPERLRQQAIRLLPRVVVVHRRDDHQLVRLACRDHRLQLRQDRRRAADEQPRAVARDRGALGVRCNDRPALPRRSAAADIVRGRGAGG